MITPEKCRDAKKISDKLEKLRLELGTQMKEVDEALGAQRTETWAELSRAYDLISLARLKIRKAAELDYPGQSTE